MSSLTATGVPRPGKQARRGSTVVEALTLLLLVGIVTRIAIPPMGEVLIRARATQIRATFTAVEGAASRLSLENLPWPPDAEAGVVPPLLAQRLPRGFSFDRNSYQLDWQNWALPEGMPGDPSVQGLIGISITIAERSLGLALMDLVPLSTKFALGETYTFIFATR